MEQRVRERHRKMCVWGGGRPGAWKGSGRVELVKVGCIMLEEGQGGLLPHWTSVLFLISTLLIGPFS